MPFRSQNSHSIFNICFDIIIIIDLFRTQLANTTQQRSTGGIWSNALNKSKHHFEETKFLCLFKND